MQGRLENQIKTENKIEKLLANMPKLVSEYYLNISTSKEFRSCLEYITKLKKFLVWYSEINDIKLEKINCTKINDSDIAKYMKTCEKKETSEGIRYTSFSYRRQIWSTLNSFFGFLDKKKYINGNPVRFIEYPTKKDNVKHVFLQTEDLDKMLKSIEKGVGSKKAISMQNKWKERDLAIFYMFIYTGMRESALCEIDLDKIDLDNNKLEVIDKERKTNLYTIPSKLKTFILDWLIKRNELLNGVECDALFISNRKERINQGAVRAIINKYSEEALGKKVSPHRLRAAYGNMIYKKTKDIDFTRKAMKHENVSTTRIYMESDEEEVNNRVADIVTEIL